MSWLSSFSPLQTKAIWLPSGEKAGCDSRPGYVVSGTTLIGGFAAPPPPAAPVNNEEVLKYRKAGPPSSPTANNNSGIVAQRYRERQSAARLSAVITVSRLKPPAPFSPRTWETDEISAIPFTSVTGAINR